MTQVVTVSAVTAAYASQPLKASARVSGSSPVEKTMRQLARETMYEDDGPQAASDIIGTSAMTLFFLSAGEKGNQPQTYRQHAEEEYLVNNLDETSAPPRKVEDEIESAAEDPLPHSDVQRPMLALPDFADIP